MSSFARVEQIRKFKLLVSEWSQAGGELTPSLKVKRRVILRNEDEHQLVYEEIQEDQDE